MKRTEQTADLRVFISAQDSTCDECGENLDRRAWITLVKDKGALCLSCADLDRLVFLPSGDAALTRHAILAACSGPCDARCLGLLSPPYRP